MTEVVVIEEEKEPEPSADFAAGVAAATAVQASEEASGAAQTAERAEVQAEGAQRAAYDAQGDVATLREQVTAGFAAVADQLSALATVAVTPQEDAQEEETAPAPEPVEPEPEPEPKAEAKTEAEPRYGSRTWFGNR